jgi:hypothetical protein
MMAKESSYLLTVERTFHIPRAKLLALKPDFSIPKGFPQNQLIQTVRIETPEGASIEVSAQFNLSHININSAEPLLDERWRLTVSLMEVSPEQVPVRSKIFASAELVALINKK